MSYRLDFHEEVQEDSSEAYEWYENKKQGLGERKYFPVYDNL
mgnify:CR=1 FL=1